MPVICPTVTAYDPHEYRVQVERLEPFAGRIHIDLMDDEFTPHKSISLDQVWWPEHIKADIHLMYMRPMEYIGQLIKLKPYMVVIHYEANIDYKDFAARLHDKGIKAGLAILQETSVEDAAQALTDYDHALVFSGNLGEHGGFADLRLLEKARQTHAQFPDMEIGWDGGINNQNAKSLIDGGIEVLNTGGFIQKADDPAAAYKRMQLVIR